MRKLPALSLMLLLISACGGSQKALIPVDSPLMPWEAPEPEEGASSGDEAAPEQPAAEAPAAAPSTK